MRNHLNQKTMQKILKSDEAGFEHIYCIFKHEELEKTL